MKIKIFTLMIALIATTGISWAQCVKRYVSPFAEPQIEGYLDNDLAFDFDDDTGLLTIASAVGGITAIPNITSSVNPWFQYARDEDGKIIPGDNGFSNGKVEDESFRDKIKKVVIWCNVTHIGNFAFNGCINMEEIVIPNSVTSIGNMAFGGCSSLTDITLSEGLESIGVQAFVGCTSLTKITVPESVTKIGQGVFGIGGIYSESNANISEIEVLWNDPQNIPSGVLEGFLGVDLAAITLRVPTGTTAAYKTASVWGDFGTITDGDEVISDFEVDTDGKLLSYTGNGGDITIPNAVKKMSLDKFSGKTIGVFSIHKNVVEISDEISPMLEVKRFNVSQENPNYSSENGVLYNKAKTVMVKYPYLSENTTYVVPNSVTKFAKTAFNAGGKNLEHMVIPSTLAAIDDMGIGRAFGSSSLDKTFKTLEVTGNGVSPINLCFTANSGGFAGYPTLQFKTLIVPAGMKDAYEASGNWNCAGRIVEKGMPVSDFQVNESGMLVKYWGEDTDIVIPNKVDDEFVVSIGPGAFPLPDVTSVTIPASVMTIEDGAFNGNTQITEIDVSWYAPKDMSASIFMNMDITQIKLLVPFGTKTLYEAKTPWKQFKVEEKPNVVQYVEKTGFMKFQHTSNSVVMNGNYLSHMNVAGDIWVSKTSEMNVFYVDKIGTGRNLIALDYEKKDGYSRGRYLYNGFLYPKLIISSLENPSAEVLNNCYERAGGTVQDMKTVEAMRVNNKLYIPISAEFDLSNLSNLVQSGKIKEIDLTKTNNFIFSLNQPYVAAFDTPYPAGTAVIVSEIWGEVFIEDNSGKAKVDMSWPPSTGAKFLLESTTPVTTQLNISPTAIGFDAPGGTRTFGITSNVAWTVSSSDSWATINVTSGSNNATITLSASANTSAASRYATVTITGGGLTKTISVSQAKVDDTSSPASQLNISTDSLKFDAGSGTKTFGITSNVEWILSSSASWATINISAGSNNATITVSASANTSAASRSALVIIAGGGMTKSVSVTQAKTETGDEPTTPTNPQEGENEIVATPSQPAGNKGTINLSLNISSNQSLNGEFIVSMPGGFNLDKEKTALAPELQSRHSLDISDKAKGVWGFKISAKMGTRSASDATLKKIIDIAYTIDENVSTGNYKILISDLDFKMSDNTTIKEDGIDVSIPYSTVGNGLMNGGVKVVCYNNTLSISSLFNEKIEIYSIVGTLVFSVQKTEGEVKYDISDIPKGIVIVKGSSGWVEKVIKK